MVFKMRMKTFTVLLLFTILSVTFLASEAAGKDAEMDISGLEEFWKIHSVLEKDSEPTQEQWDKLFATPGYFLLEQKERRRKSLSEAFRIAYMPSRKTDKENVLKTDQGWISFVVSRLIKIPPNKQKLEIFVNKDRINKLLIEARRKAQEFLPAGTIDRIPPPPISFFVFQSRGYKERIIMDALELMQHPNQSGLLGHELHHHYYHYIAKRKGETRPFNDDMLAYAIVNVEFEGTAGLVDKRNVPKMSVAELEKSYIDKSSLIYFKQYQIEYARSNHWLKFVENLLEQIADAKPEEKITLGKKLHGELPDNGRGMGTYMANVIIKQLGKKKFLETMGDSFAFWQVYNEAAKQTRGSAYVLSDKAIRVIIETGDKYRIGNSK